MKVLAVDPGEKRIGLAISDPTGTISRPLKVLTHEARAKDAQKIAEIAAEEAVGVIVIGLPLDANGEVGPRRANPSVWQKPSGNLPRFPSIFGMRAVRLRLRLAAGWH